MLRDRSEDFLLDEKKGRQFTRPHTISTYKDFRLWVSVFQCGFESSIREARKKKRKKNFLQYQVVHIHFRDN